MRRLVGLIALLALILGAAWLANNDFDLRRIAVIEAFFEPSPDGDAVKAPADEAARAPETAPGEASESAASSDAPPAAAEEESAAISEMPSAENDISMAGPAAGDVAVPEAAPPVGVVPSFDIIRVEPSGETVIAGLAAPQATIEVLDGATPLATAEANERGEWALVLEEPLQPGTHDLAIRTTSEDQSEVTLSDQRVAVSVPENADEEPLVVLNEPDAPSRVIQVPAEAESPAESEIAAAPEPEPMVEPSTPPGEAEVDTSPAMSVATGSEVAATPDAGPMTESPMASDETAVAAASPAVPLETEATAEAMAERSETTQTAETDVAAAREPDAMAEPSTSTGETEIAAAATGASSEASPETMEVAGAAKTPATEDGVAAAPSADSAEPPMAMEEPTSESPSMPSGPSSETVIAAAPPAGSEAPARPDVAAAEPSMPAAADQQGAEPAVVAEKPTPAVPKVGVAAIEAETNGALYVAGTATTSESVRIYVDEELIGEATPTEGGTWLLETEREMAPDEYKIRVDQVDAGTGAVIARAEVSFQREIEVATLKQAGETVDAGETAVSGSIAGPMKVIIKRGDNLWRISRELYGKGIRYSSIYRANRDQIRNPDLIYPGQVFVLPAGDTAWETQ